MLMVACGGLKENCPIESGRVRRCGFVGLGVALLKKVCHYGVGFEVYYAQASRSVLQSVSAACRIRYRPLSSSFCDMCVHMSPFIKIMD